MAGQKDVLTTTFVGDVALTGNTVVVFGSSDNHVAYGAAGAASGFVGVVREDADAGVEVGVQVEGIIYVSTSAAGITPGAALCIGDANGNVDLVSNHAGSEAVGIALSSNSAAGDFVLMLIKH